MTDLANAALHNVAETAPPAWADGGRALHRVPRAVGERLNVGARERYRHPTGAELRFVPREPSATVDVSLSAAAATDAYPFWGAFQGDGPIEIGPEPRELSLSMPAPLRALDADAGTGVFSPAVCRLRFSADQPVAVHGVSGPARRPRPAEVPDARLLAYGTSITEGFDASAPHLSYVPRLARPLGVDPLCLGAAGSAYCEPAMAEYLADRGDWDAAVVSISVNMANRGFPVGEFRERAEHVLERLTAAQPEAPVLAVTLFPYHADLRADADRERAAAFREALREAVATVDHDALRLAEGPDFLDATGLTTDLLHPGDAGMAAIAEGLAERLGPLLAG